MTKFLTRFNEVNLWADYPLLLSLVFGGEGDDNYLIFVIEGYDSDGSLLDTVELPVDYVNTVVDFNIGEIYGSLDGVSYLNVYVRTYLETTITETIRINIQESCDNPVYLLGRNSLGGCIQWMFGTNQEYGFDFGNDTKAKRLTLFTENLSINEWESLQDFITLGQVYRNNIVEFTSATIKTSTRIGQQVYDVDDDGNKIGVVVIPTRNRSETRQIRHTFEIEIEYPKIFT